MRGGCKPPSKGAKLKLRQFRFAEDKKAAPVRKVYTKEEIRKLFK